MTSPVPANARRIAPGLLLLLLGAFSACGGGDDGEDTAAHRSTTTTASAPTREAAADAINSVCDETNRQISALPPPDPEDAAAFRWNFAEIVRLNRAALEEMRSVEAPAEDEAALVAAVQKQERAVVELEAMGSTVEKGQPTTEEQQGQVRSAVDDAADAWVAFGADHCGRE